MNTFEVTGMKNRVYDFTNKSGDSVHSEGVEYYLSAPIDSNNLKLGHYTVKTFVTNERIAKDFAKGAPIVGDRVTAYLNRWGKYYIVDIAQK